MKQIITKDNTLLFLFSLLGLFPIVDFDVQSKLLIAWCFFSLIFGYSYFLKYKNTINHKVIIINCGWLFFLFITLIYSDDYINGLSFIRKTLPIIVIPLFLFYFNKTLSPKFISKFLWFFVIVNLIYILCIYWYLHFTFIDIYKSIYLKSGNFNLFHYINYQLENREYLYVESGQFRFFLFFHKLYFSLGIILSICILFYKISIKPTKLITLFCLSLVLFFGLNLFNFKSSTAIVFLIVVVPVYVLYLIIKHFDKLNLFKYLLIVILFIGALFVLILPEQYQNKFKNGFESRQVLNKCNIELAKNSPIIGYGIGSVQNELNNCYKLKIENDSRYLYPLKEKQNSHNNYLFIYLSGGILALILFSGMLLYNLKIALYNKDHLYILFLLIIGFVLIFENFLYRINGILFFTIFNSLFLQKYIRKN